MSSRIAVMYLGAIVEEGPTEELLVAAGHPYTRLLVAAVPEHRGRRPPRRIRLKGDAASARGSRPAAASVPAAPSRRTSAGRSSRRRLRSGRTAGRPATLPPRLRADRGEGRRKPQNIFKSREQ